MTVKTFGHGEFDLIVVHEKDGEYYWPAQTVEQWAESSLAILTERWNEGYWYSDPDNDGLGNSEWAEDRRREYEQALALTPEQIALLPQPARTVVVNLRRESKRESAEDRLYREWWDEAKQVVEAQDAGLVTVGRGTYQHEVPKAWRLLEYRSDHEHERVTLEPWQTSRKASE